MKHNSDCKPDRGGYQSAPYLTPSEENQDMRMLYYARKRQLDKDLELINWLLREGKKNRGLPMPDGWEI